MLRSLQRSASVVVREWASTSGEGDNAKITLMADGSVSQWPAQPWKVDGPSLTSNLGK